MNRRLIGNLPIENPYIDTWKPIEYITDVNSLYIYEIGEKKYFFFGDQHHSKSEGGCEEKLNIKCDDYNKNFTDGKYYGSSCTSIGILLHNWFTYNNDYYINTDFYLELGFTNEDERKDLKETISEIKKLRHNKKYETTINIENISWLELISSVMSDCFVKSKKNCPYYPNVHSHYSDVRMLENKNDVIHADPFLLFDLMEFIQNNFPRTDKKLLALKDELSIIMSIITYDYRKLINGMLSPDDFDKFIEEYSNLSKSFSSDLAGFYLKKIMNMKKISVIRDGVRMHKVAAELSRLRKETPYISFLIEELIYDKANLYIETVQELYDKVLDAFEYDIYEYNIYEKSMLIMEAFQSIVSALVPLSALSMDAYLLARMFLQTESSEIITYAGSKHIEHYSDFFENYMGIKRLAGVDSEFDNRCLNIVDLPKHLDANKYRKYVVNKKYESFTAFHKKL
jgi:hypothetical protein